MNYSSINTCECTNGSGWGVSLFMQGCPIHCKGCFNPETWSFEGGKKFTSEIESRIYELMDKPYITRFSILGGEPLSKQNLNELSRLIISIKANYPNKEIWVWSGYTWEEIQAQAKENSNLRLILRHINYLVAGPFIQEEKKLTLAWRGSSNQQVIDIQKTIAKKEVITVF